MGMAASSDLMRDSHLVVTFSTAEDSEGIRMLTALPGRHPATVVPNSSPRS
jgi:hypothetical protein